MAVKAVTEFVIGIVQEAIGGEITADSSSATHLGWDSLSHLVLLDCLDQNFNGITSRNPDLGSAESVREIAVIVVRDQQRGA